MIPRLFRPDEAPARPAGDCPTLDSVVTPYLQHLQVKALRGHCSRAHLDNVTRSLRNFADAWRVVFADGRQAILPAAAPLESAEDRPRRFKRRPPPHTAATAADAIAWASQLFPGPPAGVTAFRNGETPLSEAASDDLDRWLLANPQWRSQNAQANNVQALLNCVRWYDDETGTRAPYRRSRAPKFHRECRRNASQEEYEAMIGPGCSEPLRLAIWALWHVDGMRTCELYELRWEDFCWREDADSTIELGKHKTRAKTGKPKLLPLTPKTRAFFEELHRLRPAGSMHVFLNTEGGAWNTHSFDHNFARRRERLGLAEDLTPYCFRHSFATDAIEGGADKGAIKVLMGHEPSSKVLDAVYNKAERKPSHVCKLARQVEERVETLRTQRKRAPSEAHQLELFPPEA